MRGRLVSAMWMAARGLPSAGLIRRPSQIVAFGTEAQAARRMAPTKSVLTLHRASKIMKTSPSSVCFGHGGSARMLGSPERANSINDACMHLARLCAVRFQPIDEVAARGGLNV